MAENSISMQTAQISERHQDLDDLGKVAKGGLIFRFPCSACDRATFLEKGTIPKGFT